MKPIPGLLAAVLIAACSNKNKDHDPPTTCMLKATVGMIKNIDCGRPVLNFEDSVAIARITGSSWHVCVVDQLPSELNSLNKKLLVCVRKLKPEESFPCTAFGPGYPAVKLVSAEEEN